MLVQCPDCALSTWCRYRLHFGDMSLYLDCFVRDEWQSFFSSSVMPSVLAAI